MLWASPPLFPWSAQVWACLTAGGLGHKAQWDGVGKSGPETAAGGVGGGGWDTGWALCLFEATSREC